MAEAVQGWSRLFELTSRFLRECERNSDTTCRDKIEYICDRLEHIIGAVQRLHHRCIEAEENPQEYPGN